MWSPYLIVILLILRIGQTFCDELDDVQNGDDTNITTTNLAEINHLTRTGLNIEITLSKQSYEEDCFLTSPDGEEHDLKDVDIEGVTEFSSSVFVSCRVSIGPMDAELLGDWKLCGRNGDVQRCQKVNIKWAREDNPNEIWHYREQSKYDHAVHYGGILTPSVETSYGDVQKCHVVTPLGEDLVISETSDYPYITYLKSTSRFCSVNIGPINADTLGNWILYGYSYHFLMGYEEVRFPFNLYIYNEDDPYELSYNVTKIDAAKHIINLGTTINVEVVGSGTIEKCEFTSPTGVKYVKDNEATMNGVAYEDTGLNVACKVVVGPVTDDLLGDWLLTGKFSTSENLRTEVQHSFTIIKEDPANPIDDEEREVEYLKEENFDANLNEKLTVIIPRYLLTTPETCHIRTPDGLQFTIMDGFNIPGVEVIESDSITACGVIITLFNEDLVGNWMLISRENGNKERRLPFSFYVKQLVGAVPNYVTIAKGNDVYIRLEDPTTEHDTCHLVAPNDLQEFKYEKDDRYVENCGFIIKDVHENYNGNWEIAYGRKIDHRAITEVYVTVSEQTFSDELDDVQNGDDTNITTTNLAEINHLTRTGLNIEITLSKQSYEEECFLTSPDGEEHDLKDVKIEGVTEFSSSVFVSCRVSIGPMDADLLGDWTLCGRNGDVQRCQKVNIKWAREDNPNEIWHYREQSKYDHAVHYGGILTPSVETSYGDVQKCHVVTPLGEDLVISETSDYPYITYLKSTSRFCSVNIGPINADTLGNWILYGYSYHFLMGYEEVRFPFNLYIYNEDDPYELSYNVTKIDAAKHIINLGTTINVEVVGSGTIDKCELTSPTGVKYDKDNEATMNGVAYEDVGSNVACKIVVGPVTDDLLGDWLLTGKFSTSENLRTEVQHSFTIIKEDPANPIDDEVREVEYLKEEHFDANMNEKLTVIIPRYLLTIPETCHIRTPDGLQFTIMDGFNIPGVEVIESDSITACGVIITLSNEDLVGNWTLISRENGNKERRLPFSFYVKQLVSAVPNYVTIAKGNDVYIRLEHPTSEHDTCHLVAPNDLQEFKYEKDDRYVENCGFIIKDVHENYNGNWEIAYGRKIDHRAITEVYVTVSDPANPIDDEEREVEYLKEEHFDANMNEKLTVIIPRYLLTTPETCHIRTPDGLQFTMTDDFHISDVEVIESNSIIACGVIITLSNEDLVGNWTLISRENGNKERRLPFSFYVKQLVGAVPNYVTIAKGNDVYIRLEDPTTEHDTCHLVAPNDLQEFKYEKDDRYVENCGFIIKEVHENYNGYWEIAYGRKIDHRAITEVFVTVSEQTFSDELDDVQNGGDTNIATTNLVEINHLTRTGLNIEITLSKQSFEEECFLTSPDGEEHDLKDVNIEGVTEFSSSLFVSCRVSIGPMDADLLGDWTLCGRNGDVQRCQKVNVKWAREDNPNETWHYREQSKYDHAVHYGGILTPSVETSYGDVQKCHVVTPLGEDLVISETSDYPYITYLKSTSRFCSVNIGPINADTLGNWTLYGYSYHFLMGYEEVRFPFNLYIYNEDDPYELSYNVTKIDAAKHIINLGTTINVEVVGSGTIDKCEFTSPTGVKYDKDNEATINGVAYEDVGSNVACKIVVGPVTDDLLGDWLLTGKFSTSENIRTEVQHSFTIIKEDPANPIDDEEREVEYLKEEHFDANMHEKLTVIIPRYLLTTPETCHIRTPDGLQFTIMDGFNIPGVEVIESDSIIACGVIITLSNEDLVGNWTLISRENGYKERRLPFSLHVKKLVSAVPNYVTIAKGNDVYIRLEHPTSEHDTCHLVAPNDLQEVKYEKDDRYVENCGYIIKDVHENYNGNWEIAYGRKIDHRAITEVYVIVSEPSQTNDDNLIWVKHQPVEISFGDENAVYCRVQDPHGFTVFEGFGKCKLTVDKVTEQHNGEWKSFVGLPGKVLLHEHAFFVTVNEPESKARVTTSVTKEDYAIVLRCSVASQQNVRACKFKDPTGKVLIAAKGVGEDRYTFHDVEETFRSHVQEHNCGLRITNPMVEELGHWRCALETENDVHYGFLRTHAEVATAIESDAQLSAEKETVTAVEGDGVTMSCSVQSHIRYCYFRAPNGTVFNTWPGSSTETAQYSGAGFDAGECGIKFSHLPPQSSGNWSCHVGLDDTAVEQKALINVQVEDEMRVHQYFVNYNYHVVVSGQVHGQQPLEYCRFVRIDGTGITKDNLPYGYHSEDNLSTGFCRLFITHPKVIDIHPWTVVAKMQGHDGEVSRVTGSLLDAYHYYYYNIWRTWFWTTIFLTLMCVTCLMMFGPTKNRRWTYERASVIRNSIRKSFRKEPLPVANNKRDASAAA